LNSNVYESFSYHCVSVIIINTFWCLILSHVSFWNSFGLPLEAYPDLQTDSRSCVHSSFHWSRTAQRPSDWL